jgi:hypothetical protein
VALSMQTKPILKSIKKKDKKRSDLGVGLFGLKPLI